jgi:hypothetical protein
MIYAEVHQRQFNEKAVQNCGVGVLTLSRKICALRLTDEK